MINLLQWLDWEARYFTIALLIMLCGCGKAVSSADPGMQIINEPPPPRAMSLALVGYNYTNRYIDSFSVDDQGGGNLYISSMQSGGGGTVCCVKYWPGEKTYKVKVRWQSGACYYRMHASDSDTVYQRLHPFFKEKEVEVIDLAENRPEYMEVHFYPDGLIQVAVTANPSMPRLALSKEREDNSKYPRCPDDEQPR